MRTTTADHGRTLDDGEQTYRTVHHGRPSLIKSVGNRHATNPCSSGSCHLFGQTVLNRSSTTVPTALNPSYIHKLTLLLVKRTKPTRCPYPPRSNSAEQVHGGQTVPNGVQHG